MSDIDITFNEMCPHCRKQTRFEADFYIFDGDEYVNDYIKHTCEHCEAELEIKATLYLETSCQISVIRIPNPSIIIEDEPYHSNDPRQLSLL